MTRASRSRNPVTSRPSPAVRQALRRRNTLLFGLPMGASVDSEIVEFWLVHLNNRHFISRKGMHLAAAHNDMVRQALAIPARTWNGYLFWWEHDHPFNAPPVFEYVERLDPKRVPIVNFMYVERRMPCLPVVYDKVGESYIQWGTTPEGVERMRLADVEPGLYPVTGGVGMGCTAIHRSVFEKLAALDPEKPWYHWAAETTGEMTDDIWFCQRAITAGFPVQVETRFDIGHLGRARYDRRHYWAGLAMAMPKVDLLTEEAVGPTAKVKERQRAESVEAALERAGYDPDPEDPDFVVRDKRRVSA